MTRARPPFSLGVVVLGGGALVLSALLLLGFLLPSEWSAEASALVAAPAGDVYSYLDSPEGWRAWTTWPDSGLVREGPERGPGAAIRWDDRELGTGSFVVVDARPAERVGYAVEVGGGAMRTTGSLELWPEGDGVRVLWREEGDLGRNPLMGYWAFFMGRAQATELEKSLERLGDAAASGPRREAPADPGPTGAS